MQIRTCCSILGCLTGGLQFDPCACAADLENSEALVWDGGNGNSLPYRVFTPDGIVPGDRVPLVLFLHGQGEQGTDNLAQVSTHVDGLIDATQSTAYQSYLLAPQAPVNSPWASFGSDPNQTLQMALDLVDHLIATRAVDPDRIYVTGLSLGGIGTFAAMWHQPTRIAAAVPLSGGAPIGISGVIQDIPLWAFHGRNDNVINVENTRQVIRTLELLGAEPIYTETDGGHDIWDPIYRDLVDGPTEGQLYDWMFSQAIPTPAGTALLVIALPSATRRRRVFCH